MSSETASVVIETTTTPIPLNQLVLAPENVRPTRHSKASIREMADTLRIHRLSAPLLVYRHDDAEGYAVFAGGRRLAGLELLRDEGHLEADAPIPCIERPQCEARELSLVENLKRRPMHPAEEFTAFNDLVRAGADLTEVANRFGVTVDHVRRRQRLARVHRSIFAQFRKDRVSLDEMMAYALTDDTRAQKAVFDLLGERATAYGIRQALTEGMTESTSTLARFVTVETYRAMGGPVHEDLFSESVYLLDPALLQSLAEAKLDAEADTYRTAGWGWVESRFERAYTYDYPDRLSGSVTVPSDLAAQRDTLTATLDALEDTMYGDADVEPDEETIATYKQAERELAKVEARIEALPIHYDPAEMKLAGCVVSLGHDGTVHTIEGIVRKPDRALLARLQQGDAPSSEAPDEAVADTPSISGALARDLGLIRRSAIRQTLVEQPKAAITILHFQLVDRLLREQGPTYLDRAHVLDLSPTIQRDPIAGDAPPVWLSREPYRPLLDALPIEAWSGSATADERFVAFTALRTSERNALVALAIAATLVGGEAGRGEDALMDRLCDDVLGVDFATRYRPDAHYFSRLKKAELVELGLEFWGDAFKVYRTSHKAALVERFVQLFDPATDETTLTDRECELRTHWLPPQIG